MSGWGIEAILSTRSAPFGTDAYLDLLDSSRIRWLRERSPGEILTSSEIPYETARRKSWREQKNRGFQVVAWWGKLNELPIAHDWNRLPENLLDLYHDALLLGEHVTEPAAWEIFNEPDAFFMSDPAERVAMVQKAIYLGIKDGAARRGGEPPIVLMGSLAHAPTPWLERVVANGHLEYTDALNIHFYGHARDFRDFVRVHRDFAAKHGPKERTLPIWMTECGIDGVPDGDYDDAAARELQAVFTLETARGAVAEDLAVFMPFLLVAADQRGGGVGGHDMVKNPTEHYPAWEVYRDFTKARALSNPPVSNPPTTPGRIIVQWIPDYDTCVPHKVSGAYWSEFGSTQINGTVYVYNLSNEPARGEMVADVEAPASLNAAARSALSGTPLPVEIPPMERIALPVSFAVPAYDFYRSEVVITFDPAESKDPSHKAALVTFAVESRPTSLVLDEDAEIAAFRPDADAEAPGFQLAWPDRAFHVTSVVGPWVGVNGAVVTPIDGATTDAGEDLEEGRLSEGWKFAVEATPAGINPKTSPPVAVTRVNGLPDVENGFLRVQVGSAVFGQDGSFRVDLIDEEGQRFAIAENFGANRFSSTPGELLLAYRDFHLYAWGRVTENYKLDPKKVREIQLRMFMTPDQPPMEVRIDVVSDN